MKTNAKSQLKLILILIGLFFLISIAFFVYFILSSGQDWKSWFVTKNVSEKSDSGNEWKTYENEELGFKFVVPSNLRNFELPKAEYKEINDELQPYEFYSNSFNFRTYHKEFETYLFGKLNGVKVDPQWSQAEFEKNVKLGIYELGGYRKLGEKAILTIQHSTYECSGGIGVDIYVPTKNSNYLNFIVGINIQNIVDKDPLMVQYENDIKAGKTEPCNPPYEEISEKIMKGESSEINALIEKAQIITDSFESVSS